MAHSLAGELLVEKPNIIALTTTQMYAFCDLLGIPKEKQQGIEAIVPLLEKADFSKLEVIFQVDQVEDDIVESRKVKLGRV